jgi:DNA-binding NarL/FixJ family response regulator
MTMTIRILIADRQSMFREVLEQLLLSQPDFEIAGSTDNGERLPALVEDLDPDVLLLETRLRRRSGVDALRDIYLLRSSVRPILLTDDTRSGEIVQCLLHGACGLVRKEEDISILYKAIRAVSAGEFWLSHGRILDLVQNLRAMAEQVQQNSRFQIGSLSRQQRRIVEAIVNGCTSKQIAEDLSVSERTVKYHLTHIFRKLGVSGRMELARFSFNNNIAREA